MKNFRKNLIKLLAAAMSLAVAAVFFLNCTFHCEPNIKNVSPQTSCRETEKMPEPAEHNTFFSDSLQRSRLNANNSKRRSSSTAANNKSGTSLYQVPLYALNDEPRTVFSGDLHLFVFQNYIKYSLPERAGPHTV